MAEASHNRVLVVQLISLQHVSWPRRNPTLTPKVARRVNEVHRELLNLIEMRDPTGARHLMDDHVKMIRARRVAEHRRSSDDTGDAGMLLAEQLAARHRRACPGHPLRDARCPGNRDHRDSRLRRGPVMTADEFLKL